jgi:peptide-methionine (S)-S-oxide reductase
VSSASAFVAWVMPTAPGVKEILTAKARAGVAVRLLYDPLGSHANLSRAYIREMHAAGVRMVPTSPLYRLHTISYRNHRKIAVVDGRVGYTGGDVPNATYRNHGTHAEAIEIVFDPEVTSYRELLEFFFQIHDPTTRNRQGNDIGASYRSAIFYLDEDQRRVAEDTIADVEASGLWPGKVVTEVTPAGPFWEAEPEHQDYLERYPNGYTCHFPRPGWVLPHRSAAAR